jgi:hypothetical protein
MDPFSLVTGCVGLLAFTVKVGEKVKSFSSRFHDASRDMIAVRKELKFLHNVLELLQDEVEGVSVGIIAESLNTQIMGVFKSCEMLFYQIIDVLARFEEGSVKQRLSWVDHGSAEVERFRESLEIHRSALDVGIQALNL